MTYRNANYSAFYVDSPFDEKGLGANKAEDFRYYNMLRMWRAGDSSFPFVDAHEKNYNVRDGSDWELTLKPRLRERIRCSKNLVLFLSSVTVDSRALHEEVDYAINDQGLPVIVVYPGYSETYELLDPYNGDRLSRGVESLWDRLPIFRDSMNKVAVLHVPLRKAKIADALSRSEFTVQQMTEAGNYFFR